VTFNDICKQLIEDYSIDTSHMPVTFKSISNPYKTSLNNQGQTVLVNQVFPAKVVKATKKEEKEEKRKKKLAKQNPFG
jgi:hypothetical protein